MYVFQNRAVGLIGLGLNLCHLTGKGMLGTKQVGYGVGELIKRSFESPKSKI